MRVCEARTVLQWPIHKRREYIAMVTDKRGSESAAVLMDEIRRQYENQKTRPPHGE
jgi:hypothetical protein